MPSSGALRYFFRRAPQPARLRIRTENDEERIIELAPQVHSRWKAAEDAVMGARAVVVECLDATGGILRSMRLREEGEEDDDEGGGSIVAGGGGDEAKRTSQALGRERRELGGMFEAYGRQLNTAFDRGAAAASSSQEHLVGLVETLTGHLSMAITNLHNVSVNLVTMMQQQAAAASVPELEGSADNHNAQLLEKVLAMAAAKAMGGDAPPPNGRGKTT